MIFIFITLPVTVFLLAKKSADVAQKRENNKYTSRDNIIYYIEKLNGISPTTISLMQNLDIEEEKDLTATIMKLQLNGNIIVENDTIKILSNDVSNLTSNEKNLFYMFQSGEINRQKINSWKNVALEEAKAQGYIKIQYTSQSVFFKKIIILTLFILSYLGFQYANKDVFANLENDMDKAIAMAEQIEQQEAEGNNLSEYQLLAENENSKYLLNALFEMLFILICSIGVLGLPIFYVVFSIICHAKKGSLKRTVNGEQLTDEILGMKKFIHDFSMLDEADKDSLILWDDFLIYAIVLEENTKIVDEILNLKNIESFDSKLIIKE